MCRVSDFFFFLVMVMRCICDSYISTDSCGSIFQHNRVSWNDFWAERGRANMGLPPCIIFISTVAVRTWTEHEQLCWNENCGLTERAAVHQVVTVYVSVCVTWLSRDGCFTICLCSHVVTWYQFLVQTYCVHGHSYVFRRWCLAVYSWWFYRC